MTLRLFDSATREVRPFVPLRPGQVGIYVCGATLQTAPHIGHVRAQVVYDVARRWLERCGYRVTLIRNVTDIDDKVLAKAAASGEEWWARAYRHEREFTAAYEALNVLPPTYEPRATGHITEMVELIQRLLEAGHAYPAVDGSGDVYFDVRSWPAYGELTRQQVDAMEPAADAEPRGKRDPHDFALWKQAKPGEPATAAWPSPWGRGRPGWHLECSAMARRYLGPDFDIHGGGIDLRFPHHENERAQSRAAGDGFARYWMHNGWVVADGEKMSKSLGNTLSMSVLLRQVRPVVLRYLLAVVHYRSSIEIGDDDERTDRLAEAGAGYQRIEGFVERTAEILGEVVAGPGAAAVPVCAEFAEAMDDDFGVAAAMAVVHETVREGNTALEDGDLELAGSCARAVRSMTGVLGVDPLDPHWSAGSVTDRRVREVLERLVRAELDERAAARKERDFETADGIRERLSAAGVAVEDTPDGARWTLHGDAHAR